ncbi:helix-turn-helix domain-containing protein [Cysteiniphilum halobium]|uniref:helix-turn-helix domain-containing protein n=1 Tax=Cysteiniphilum halobium TaxID=2219059 RepID=UPI003F876064
MLETKKTQQALSVVAPWFKPPINDSELNQLINLSLELADLIGDNTQHEYLPILEIIEQHIADYENMHLPELSELTTPNKLVQFLMAEYNLKQKDLVDIFGNQGNVSKFLNGHRQLTLEQVAKLSKRFNLSADAFISWENMNKSDSVH